jgi:hypothetical protein
MVLKGSSSMVHVDHVEIDGHWELYQKSVTFAQLIPSQNPHQHQPFLQPISCSSSPSCFDMLIPGFVGVTGISTSRVLGLSWDWHF